MSGSIKGGSTTAQRPFDIDIPPSEGSKVKQSYFRKAGNGRASPSSPLKLFGQAKKRINDIFAELSGYVRESATFLEGIKDLSESIDASELQRVKKFGERVDGIIEIINRDRMKVAFFGRTSNGKSTVINAMLGCRILPTGLGHTTNCFLQVEGTDERDAFLLTGEHREEFNQQNVTERASAISDNKAETNTLMRICWPEEKCQLLREDVVFVDSPGVDINPDMDGSIDMFCLDADVFILVANAESTLMQTEKNFFHKVSERLSKPNIFVLNNRWDASSLEPDYMQEVRQQHLDRIVSFLVDELKVVASRTDAENRVYFISAREALIARLQATGGPRTPGTPGGQLLEGHQARLFEFCSFEKKFEECISKSAVQTKFHQHAANGKMIVSDLRTVLEGICDKAQEKSQECQERLEETKKALAFTDQKVKDMTLEFKDTMQQLSEEVSKKVTSVFNDEIRRLPVLLDEFERPFHPDRRVLAHYKKDLIKYLDSCYEKSLSRGCKELVLKLHADYLQSFQERVSGVLPEKAHDQLVQVMPMHPFEPAYRLDCKNLFSDFQEDLQFRFSLGITTLMRRFLGDKGTKSLLQGHQDMMYRPMPRPGAGGDSNFPPADTVPENAALMALMGQLTQLYSGSTLGTLAVAGVVIRAAGWQVLAVVGTLYGLVYLYERLTWTSKAQEKAFKTQFAAYASEKLRLIVELTGSNCGHQFLQELSSTFARAQRVIDQQQLELQRELQSLEGEMGELSKVTNDAKVLKNKSTYVDSEIKTFISEYLHPETVL